MNAAEIDPRPGYYYVSVIRGDDYRLLAGPYRAHAEALGAVNRVRETAQEIDPRAAWYAFGTARTDTPAGPGILNGSLGLPLVWARG